MSRRKNLSFQPNPDYPGTALGSYSIIMKTLCLLFLILTTVSQQVVAGFSIDWSTTVDSSTFGFPTSENENLTLNPNSVSIYIAPELNRVVIRSYWYSPEFPSVSSFIVTDSQGKILARVVSQGGGGQPIWCRGDTLVFSGSSSPHPVIWTFQPDASVTEEPFPFGGEIRGGNLRIGAASPLFTVQSAETSFTVRKIGFTQDNAARSLISLSTKGVTVSTETEDGQTYKVQSSQDLEQWQDEEVFQGDGNTKSVEHATDKPKEFLRVVED
jgi:hypothetical protein